jgi:hypothetical protein
MFTFRKSPRARQQVSSSAPRARLSVEALESRLAPTTLGGGALNFGSPSDTTLTTPGSTSSPSTTTCSTLIV